jgi:CBS domain containing-hemolysin-like protein
VTSIALVITALSGLGVTCLAAVGIRALARFSPHALKAACRRRNVPERVGQVLRWRREIALALQTLGVLATAVFAAAAGFWVWRQSANAGPPGWGLLIATALVAGVLLLLGGIWIPRIVAEVWAEPLLCLAWPLLRGIGLVLWPLVAAARLLDIAVRRLAGKTAPANEEEVFEEDIRVIVSEGHREGLLEEDAREMIEGVIELGDADVGRVMTPRTDMVSLAAALSWPEMLDAVVKAGHTRLPVSGRSRDDIQGILYTKDLLRELAKPTEQRMEPWTKLLREALFVPETKPIDSLLQELQRTRNHMAVVLDEYGGVSGLVTMEDVLEEIVGEIADEHDAALIEGICELDGGMWEVQGRSHLDEINERLGLKLPEDAEFDTIAGFVFSELGHVPVAGEQLTWQNVRITVLEASRRRIEKVRIECLKA